MLLKEGVDISRLRPEIRRKLNTIASSIELVTLTELIITSTYEGTHKPGSLHYANLAIDIRLTPKSKELVKALKLNLGTDYLILLESTHIHIQWNGEYK